jgi:lysophospholipase L1-like esterase
VLGVLTALPLGCAGQPEVRPKSASVPSAQGVEDGATPPSNPVPGSPPNLAANTISSSAHEGAEAHKAGAHAHSGQRDPAPNTLGADVPQDFPQGSKVLQVGDSFAGALGVPLGRMLEARGVHSVLKARDASYLTDWAWDGELQKQIWKYNPDLVVITLGANELKISEPEARAKTVKKLVSILAGRPCVWIAIPLWDGPQNGLLDVIEKNLAPCIYLDTNALMDTAHMARIEDGIHPTASAREGWARVVIGWLEAHRKTSGPLAWSLEN